MPPLGSKSSRENLFFPTRAPAPVSEPIYRFDDKFHLGARVQSSREDLSSPTRAPGTRQRTDLSV